jgi:gliding motility-associated-like protein
LKHLYAYAFILFILAGPIAIAQGEASIWYFGDKAGIDFTSGQPVPIFNGQLNTIEGCSVISDATGHVLFYTNGITVWNKLNATMANGTGLAGDVSSSQAALIVQKPGSANLFYIFTTNAFDGDGGFRYSIVDMSLANGNGAVTSKNNVIATSSTEKLAAINHADGQDVWIISHAEGNDEFEARLLTASGLGSPVVSHAGCNVTTDDDHSDAIGYLKASPDGRQLVACHTFLNKTELFDFDRASGVIANARNVASSGEHIYGAEFSADGRMLYLSAVDENKLFQYSLNAPDIAASRIEVATFSVNPGALQLGPDGKIYIAMAQTDKLSVVAYPNRHGAACTVQPDAIDLQGRNSLLGLPSFNQGIFYTHFSAQYLCAGSDTSFHFDTPYAVQSVNWDFGDNGTSAQTDPQHHYPAAGTYAVTITATYPGCVISRTEDVYISAIPATVSLAAQKYCAGGSVSLSSFTAQLLGGQPQENFTVTYFASQQDAENDQGQLDDSFDLIAGNTTIYARIQNAGGCFSVTHFSIKAFAQPSGLAPADLVACDGFVRDAKAEFDLESKTLEISGNENFDVKYYVSQDDAESMENPVSGIYTNTSNPQTIFARVQNAQGCYQIVSFQLIVNDCREADENLFPKFFTPNGDGSHDTWSLKGIPGLENANVDIFDRYGRIVKRLNNVQPDWDGTSAGTDLPADDYWFVISGAGIGEYRGHFALMR